MAEAPRSGDGIQAELFDFPPEKVAVLDCLKQAPWEIMHVGDALRADRDVVLVAVRQYGQTVQYASPELRGEKAIVLEAVSRDWLALQYASEALQEDRDVALAAARRNGHALKYVGTKLREDRDFVLEAVKLDRRALEYASAELRDDEAIVFEAVKQNVAALQLAGEALRGNRHFILQAMKLDECALFCATEDCQQDQDLLLLAARVVQDIESFELAPKAQALLQNRNFQLVQASAIAVQGEDAPILTVELSEGPGSGVEGCTDSGLHFEATLMSGLSFRCSLASGRYVDEHGIERPGPIMNDLAKQLLGELEKHSKAARRIFITFLSQSHQDQDPDRDPINVSPWDWERPISEILAPPKEGVSLGWWGWASQFWTSRSEDSAARQSSSSRSADT